MREQLIPKESIRRLSVILRTLNRLKDKGRDKISSSELADILGINSAQIRKDFSYFGKFGIRGVGYKIEKLIEEIRSILNLDKEWKVALVGVGNLGQALLSYPGFKKQGFEIIVAFDKSQERIGKKIGRIKVEDVDNLEEKIEEEKIKLAIITTPSESAQEVASRLVRAGVKTILSFAPCSLDLPKRIKVSYVDIAMELAHLVYYL